MTQADHPPLTRYAWLSIAAALSTMALKAVAYWLTGSVGLLSDALESIVNLVGAGTALAMLTIAARPADEEHAYGHTKAEYFSSGVEGTLILVAALSIGWTALQRLLNPQPIEDIGLGLGISIVSSLINLAVALVLRRAGRRYNSISLTADSSHLLTDVWTSVAVVVGVGAVAVTGWQALDPIVAFLVALNIIWSGVHILRSSVLGLMDTALPPDEVAQVRRILDAYTQHGLQYHALRTRQSGARRFVSFHILVPGQWTVQRGHHLLEKIEADLRQTLPGLTVFTHLESLNDPASWEDTTLDRPRPANGSDPHP